MFSIEGPSLKIPVLLRSLTTHRNSDYSVVKRMSTEINLDSEDSLSLGKIPGEENGFIYCTCTVTINSFELLLFQRSTHFKLWIIKKLCARYHSLFLVIPWNNKQPSVKFYHNNCVRSLISLKDFIHLDAAATLQIFFLVLDGTFPHLLYLLFSSHTVLPVCSLLPQIWTN